MAGDDSRWSPLQLLRDAWLLNVGDRNVDRLWGHVVNVSSGGAHTTFAQSSGVRTRES